MGIVRFTVNGRTYHTKVGSADWMKIGARINVLHDPSDPSINTGATYWTLWGYPTAFAFLGCLMLVGTAFTLYRPSAQAVAAAADPRPALRLSKIPDCMTPSVPGALQLANSFSPPGAGQVLSEHDRGISGRPVARWGALGLGGAATVAGAVAMLLHLDHIKSIPFGLGLVALMFGAFLFILGLVLRYSVWSVQVTTDGLTWVDRKGVHSCAWQEITGVYRRDVRMGSVDGDRFTNLRVETANGDKLSVNHALSNYEQLCATVQRVSTEVILPCKRQELEREGATFGTVTLMKHGIRIDGDVIHWHELDHYYVGNGHFVLYPVGALHGDCFTFLLESIPNYLVLLQLLRALGIVPISGQASAAIMLAR